MVCGHLDTATEEFRLASQLQPADTISQQLHNLCAVTARPDDKAAAPAQPADKPGGAPATPPVDKTLAIPATPPAPEPVPVEKLNGTWVADKGAQGVVTLAIKDEGKFAWDFTKDGKSQGFGGEYSMNDDGLLVLDSEDAQMVATVALPREDTLKFVIAGGPPGDPGLEFNKKK
jgi:hypothetical protein